MAALRAVKVKPMAVAGHLASAGCYPRPKSSGYQVDLHRHRARPDEMVLRSSGLVGSLSRFQFHEIQRE